MKNMIEIFIRIVKSKLKFYSKHEFDNFRIKYLTLVDEIIIIKIIFMIYVNFFQKLFQIDLKQLNL